MLTYAKAIYGATGTGLASLLIAYEDEVLTRYEVLVVVTAVFGAFGVIWGVPNEAEVNK